MKKLAYSGVILGVLIFWWQHDSDSKLAFDRFWIDHMPRAGGEQFQAFVINGEHPFGHFAVQTEWKGQWEGFHYHAVPRTGDFDLIMPASNRRERVHFHARTCNEEGFDYCLEITGGSDGPRRYYSKRAWDREETAMQELKK
jgi:hypothetical protein